MADKDAVLNPVLKLTEPVGIDDKDDTLRPVVPHRHESHVDDSLVGKEAVGIAVERRIVKFPPTTASIRLHCGSHAHPEETGLRPRESRRFCETSIGKCWPAPGS